MTADLPAWRGGYPVRVIRSAKRIKTVSARIVKGVVQIRIPDWMSPEEEHRTVSGIVARMEKERRCYNVDLEDRARRVAHRFDLPEPVSIRWSTNQRYRWGSCTTGTGHIRISSRLTEVPPWVLDYVIVHELAHLVVPDHSAAFYELVNRNPLSERAAGYLLAFDDLAEIPPTPAPAAPPTPLAHDPSDDLAEIPEARAG